MSHKSDRASDHQRQQYIPPFVHQLFTTGIRVSSPIVRHRVSFNIPNLEFNSVRANTINRPEVISGIVLHFAIITNINACIIRCNCQ